MVMAPAKRLTEFDIKNSFKVPPEWLAILPSTSGEQGETQLCVTDGLGFFWEFRCMVRRGSIEYYQLDGALYARNQVYLHSEEWLKFVNFKGLKVKDRVILDTVENEFRGTKFRLRAQKLRDGHDNDNGDDDDDVRWIDV